MGARDDLTPAERALWDEPQPENGCCAEWWLERRDLLGTIAALRATWVGLDRLRGLRSEIETIRRWRAREGWLNAPMSERATTVLGVVLEVLDATPDMRAGETTLRNTGAPPEPSTNS